MDNNRNKPFPRLLRRWRRTRQMTRADAARHLMIPYRTLEDWEAGKHAPRGLALRFITEKLSR